MPKSDKVRGFFYQALGGGGVADGIEPMPRFFPQPPTEPQDTSVKRESFFSKGMPVRADREPDASWYRPSNHKPNVYPNTYEQAAYQKREEEKAKSGEAIHNFLGKVGYEVMEGIKRGFVPGYYDKWLESLTPEERAELEKQALENRENHELWKRKDEEDRKKELERKRMRRF